MNVFTGTGNLTKDAEMRFTSDGTAVASFSVAISAGYGKNEKTSYLNCSLFGKRGEAIAQYLLKGTKIAVTGEIYTNEYETKDKTLKQSLNCNVQAVTLLGKKEPSEPKEASKANNHQPQPEDDENIPF